MQHGHAQGAHGASATAARGRAGHSAAGAEGTRSARCNATGICRCTCWCTAFCNTATWQCEGRRAAGPRRPHAEQCVRVARMGLLHAAVRRWRRRQSRGGGAGKTRTRVFCNGILRLRQFRNGWTRCDHTELEAIILGHPPTWRTKAARPKPRDGEEGGSTTGGMRCTGAGRRDVAICPEATCGGTSRRSMASRAATLTATRTAKIQKRQRRRPVSGRAAHGEPVKGRAQTTKPVTANGDCTGKPARWHACGQGMRKRKAGDGGD